jgi:hypothetical protein
MPRRERRVRIAGGVELDTGIATRQGNQMNIIDKTMDGKKLPAGNYIMSVVSEGKTASILFTIK